MKDGRGVFRGWKIWKKRGGGRRIGTRVFLWGGSFGPRRCRLRACLFRCRGRIGVSWGLWGCCWCLRRFWMLLDMMFWERRRTRVYLEVEDHLLFLLNSNLILLPVELSILVRRLYSGSRQAKQRSSPKDLKNDQYSSLASLPQPKKTNTRKHAAIGTQRSKNAFPLVACLKIVFHSGPWTALQE